MQKELVKALIISVFIVYASLISAQHNERPITEAEIDSVSWQQYLAGDWDGLTETGKLARKANIDFKWLQQRLGYAWFVKGDYYKSRKHYQRAIRWDDQDEISHLYLHYNSLYTGQYQAARYHAGKLPVLSRNADDQQLIRLLNSIDAEYAFKRPEKFYRESELRKDAQFRRIGIHSLLGHHISLYQSVSGYVQDFDFVNSTNQLEYFGLVSAQLTTSLSAQAGYRYVGTRSLIMPDTFYTPGHSFNAQLNYNFYRFNISAMVNYFSNEYISVNQWGLQAGVGFSGTIPVYLRSSLYSLAEQGTNALPNLVFNQTAGMLLFKRIWLEGSVTLGEQNYFTSDDGMYFYNSQDPVVFKTGASIRTYVNQQLSFIVHYGLEKKYMNTYDEYYYQHGLTGGIAWKL